MDRTDKLDKVEVSVYKLCTVLYDSALVQLVEGAPINVPDGNLKQFPSLTSEYTGEAISPPRTSATNDFFISPLYRNVLGQAYQSFLFELNGHG